MNANFCFRCGKEFFRMELFCPQCGTQRRRLDKETIFKNNDIEEVIEYYFNVGTQFKKMVLLLERYHDTKMSVSTLKRHLRTRGLKRKGRVPIDMSIRRLIETEVHNSSGIKGYRSIWHKLRVNYGIVTNRDEVMKVLKEINPEQSKDRKARKLKRRIYSSPGPNHVWHADGYDKLKPFGFPIHGCVDGFSRKVIWLNLCRSNNDPIVPAHYFLNALKSHKVCPNLLRTDCGTENGIMASFQSLIYNNVDAHRYGTSQSNVRIENLWSHYKRTYTTWIIEYFKNMVNNGDLRLGDHFQMECIWFTYSGLLQSELDKMVEEWNTHSIRKSRHTKVWGIPDEMFDLPELYGYQKCGRRVNNDVVEWILNQRDIHTEAFDILNQCNEEFTEYFKYVVNVRGFTMPPCDWDEARTIYDTIISFAT